MFCTLETLNADTIWITTSIKIRNHFRCCCYCALEKVFLVKASFVAFGSFHTFWTEPLKHPPRSSQFFTSYTQSHSIIVLLFIQNIFKTLKGEVVFWQNRRQFLWCCKTLDSLRRRFKKQATCLFRFFLVFLLFLSSFLLVHRFKSTVCHFRALKLYIDRPRLETNCNLVSKSNIPPINLVCKSIYHRIEGILLASSKFGQSQKVIEN